MSRTKIESLTPAQEQALADYREECLSVGRSTEPADRQAAERVWREMYKALGQPEPIVCWWDGPATDSLARTLLTANPGVNLGDNLRANLGASLGDSLGDSLRANLSPNLGANLGDSLGDSLRASLRDNLWANLWDSIRDNLWANLRVNLGDSLSWYFWGQHELYWSAYYDWPDVALRRMHAAEHRKRLDWWLVLGRSTGWWHPFSGIVMACERPSRQSVDVQGRLHHESGPALLCRDSWAVYAWHGVRVDQRVIEQPDTITAQESLAETNAEVRRVMVERMGYGKFIAQANPLQLDSDVDGAGQDRRLLRVEMAGDEPLIAVEVKCPSTGRQYLLRVPPQVETCQSAVAWTFGLDAAKYAPVAER